MSDLESFLKGPAKAEAAPAVVEAAAVETPEAKEAKARDEAGRFAKVEPAKVEAQKEEPKVETPPAAKEVPKVVKPPEVTGLEAGIAAERTKRQEAERRVAEFEARIKAMEQRENQRANPPAPPPDPLTDPQGFAQTFQQQMQAMQINQRVDMSVAVARMKHQDFDQALDEWNGLIAQDQNLYTQAVQQKDPAEWAYQHVKRQQLLKEVGDDPASYRTKLEAEIRQKLEAEYQQRTPVHQVIPAPPPSLAGARSNGRVSDPVWTGPPPLSSLFKR